jgi:hypothetical protein
VLKSHGSAGKVLMLRSPSHGKSLNIKLQVKRRTYVEVRQYLMNIYFTTVAWRQGEGMTAALIMEPASGEVDFGNLVEGKTLVKTVTLKNVSPFALHYQLRLVKGARENYSHLSPFQVESLCLLHDAGQALQRFLWYRSVSPLRRRLLLAQPKPSRLPSVLITPVSGPTSKYSKSTLPARQKSNTCLSEVSPVVRRLDGPRLSQHVHSHARTVLATSDVRDCG